ncbi:MAG TPA: EAL domain-containing protein [Gemmatimonadaceae bacterium]|nr:EAL domain-containing protein [Gemmatimonadaceae bacterium]
MLAALLPLAMVLGAPLLWSLVRQRRARARRALEMTRLDNKLQRARHALRQSEERYALAALAANDGLWDWDLVRDRCDFSPRWRGMLGLENTPLLPLAREWLDRVHPDDATRLRADIDALLTGTSPRLESEHRLRHADGNWRWVLVRALALREGDLRPLRIAGSMTDISARKRAEEELRRAAMHDALTGLVNRAYFLESLERAVARVQRRPDKTIALLFLDLDRFKQINDGLGHLAGDRLLTSIARRLQGCVRPGDVLARLGGDEFAVLLDDLKDPTDATRIAERMQEALHGPLRNDESEVVVTASIGIAFGGADLEGYEELLRDADLAMYRAKASGKARFEVFDTGSRATERARMELENDLRRALERGELRVHYQPIVNAGDGRIVAFEALARWAHPQRGLLNAASFIPLAEESGTISALGRWVLREALAQLAQWQRDYPSERPLGVSVNLSPREVLQPRLPSNVAEALREANVSPESLALEITESLFIDTGDATLATLRELAGLGVKLHLDDFGTGYSSLSYLHRFPISAVKIDRYFVSRLDAAECEEIVRSVVELSKRLGMDTIAEGAESDEQGVRLRDIGCNLLQGYACARPVPPREAEALLARQAGMSERSRSIASAHLFTPHSDIHPSLGA